MFTFNKVILLLALLFSIYFITQPVQSLRGYNNQNPKQIVLPFYTKCLTANNETGIEGVAQILDKLLTKDFRSINAEETKTKPVMIGSIQYFWKLIPNLKWEVREMLQDKDRVIVRSRATGNPIGNFFGVPCNGSKSFDIMTIDIHTVVDGQISTIYHEEEWTLAIKQLSGN